jgi:membrane protein implicated in regulation of membrane protease activity
MSAEWLHWYYLIYLLPAAIAVLVLLMTGIGGHHGGHSHAAHGAAHSGMHLHAHSGGVHGTATAGHAHPAAGTHSPAHAAPAHGAHTASHAHGGHHGHSEERSMRGIAPQLLGFFGVGRAPITIVLASLLIGWGLFGMAVTDFLKHGLHLSPVLFVAPSLAAAAAGGLLCAKFFGEIAARLMPQDESYAIRREGLLGQTGKVVYPVSEVGGRVHVFDQFRTLHVESARVSPGHPPIEKGTEVIVASLDPDHGYLIVEPLGFSRSAISPQPSAVAEEETLKLQNRDG